MRKALLSIYFRFKQPQHFTISPIQHHNNNVVMSFLRPFVRSLVYHQESLKLLLTLDLYYQNHN